MFTAETGVGVNYHRLNGRVIRERRRRCNFFPGQRNLGEQVAKILRSLVSQQVIIRDWRGFSSRSRDVRL